MGNERKTEKIVSSHFEGYNNIIKIEEQSSDIPKINKLLKAASKKGGGKGYPEFIITFNKNSDLLIVVECKADIMRHESPNKDRFAEYAVDGALLYASFLSKEYDVLAIGVSGETRQHLKVSHFLHLKGERKAVPMFADKLLPVADYLNGYLKSPEKFRQDYNTLLAFTKTLNDKLHRYKILESQRSLLLSAILIALEDDAFRASYDKKTTPKSLADFLTKTVSEKLEDASISYDKLNNLNIQFGFIKTDTSLAAKDGLLKELIDEIDTNINQFIKTHEYFDVLGQLYIEFLKYANSDKGLGIVLTPPHITELFAELAQVNKNSVIYDNCTGTGGFLISAMKYMVKDACGEEKKIRQIKASQLIGVEYQAHIFALAVSNMYIHQDGKTNIINGDCFDNEVMALVKAQKPTVGFLNPPYQSNKKNDTDELEFVLNNLECLVDGGVCIAIVPMQKALATTGKVFDLKKRLLEKHTLEAVLSMPDELFVNSKVSVVTCVMIFTAHKKHRPTKKTYFGYYKDDGFIKRKILGRFDGLGKWKMKKREWCRYFLDENRKEEAGFSVNKTVTASDEWCAEAYMETDYLTICDNDFIKKMKAYAAFRLLYNDDLSLIFELTPYFDKKLKLDVETWKWFRFDDIFEIKKGKRLTKADQVEGDINYIGATEYNNGVTAKISNDKHLHRENKITVSYNGSIAEAFYQSKPFWATDDVNVLYPKFQLNPFIAMFLCTLIHREKYRFNYGLKWDKEKMQCSKIKLPMTPDGSPDWLFMENYIKSLPYSKAV